MRLAIVGVECAPRGFCTFGLPSHSVEFHLVDEESATIESSFEGVMSVAHVRANTQERLVVFEVDVVGEFEVNAWEELLLLGSEF